MGIGLILLLISCVLVGVLEFLDRRFKNTTLLAASAVAKVYIVLYFLATTCISGVPIINAALIFIFSTMTVLDIRVLINRRRR